MFRELREGPRCSDGGIIKSEAGCNRKLLGRSQASDLQSREAGVCTRESGRSEYSRHVTLRDER